MSMYFKCQFLNPLAQLPGNFSQLRILLEQRQKLLCMPCGKFLPLLACLGKRSPVLCVRIGMRLVAVGLPGLGKQNQRGCIRCLQAECEIQQNERDKSNLVKPDTFNPIHTNTITVWVTRKNRGSEKAGERLGLQGEPVITKNRCKVIVLLMKPVIAFVLLPCRWN